MEGIRICREAAGLNQSELARRLNVSPVAVNKMERPGNFPAAEKLPAIADALDTSIDALFERGKPSGADCLAVGYADPYEGVRRKLETRAASFQRRFFA